MKDNVYRLVNQIKNYEWGSPSLIPKFLGKTNTHNIPNAEMWMGTHETAPSLVKIKLNNSNNEYGEIPLKEISGELPFLFKLLAVEKPLSIQAHPDKKKAVEGYQLEESLGLSLRAPRRNYKDPNHKSELVCALSKFRLMAGFKEIQQINESINDFLLILPQLKEVLSPLQKSLNTGNLAVFLRMLFNLSRYEKEYISELIINKDIEEKQNHFIFDKWSLMKKISLLYPKDPAILSPLYLNYITLDIGQAVFLPPGILHSYIEGFGIELMTSSDNVLRGGLTPKFIDVPELMNIIDFMPYYPEIISFPVSSKKTSLFSYEKDEFSLSIIQGTGEKQIYTGKRCAICLVTEGELFIEKQTFKKGDSFYISKANEEIIIEGNFKAFIASSEPSVK